MTDALTRAFSTASRSLLACKAAVGSSAETLLAQGPSGMAFGRPDLQRATEQFRHFKNWAFSAIRPICQKVAEVPVRVGRVAAGQKLGTKQAANVKQLDTHPFLDLLANPNPLMTSWSLLYTAAASMEICGRSLWWLPGKSAIWPIPISWVTSFEGGSRWTSFKIRTPYSGEEFEIDADECVFAFYPDPSDPHGAISPLQAAWSAIDADEQIITTQASIFRRGIMPTSAIILGEDGDTKVRPRLEDSQRRQIINAVRKMYAGAFHAGEPLILDQMIADVKPLQNTPREMDFVKSGDAIKARIFQAFGVSAIIAGEIEGSNRASSDAADRHFIRFCIGPKLELMSQTLTSWLRVVYGEPDLVVWFERPVADDAAVSLQWANILATFGCITGDELRGLSPFTLEPDRFPDVVTPGRTQAEQQADATYKALQEQADATNPRKLADGYLGAPTDDDIDPAYTRNGRHK